MNTARRYFSRHHLHSFAVNQFVTNPSNSDFFTIVELLYSKFAHLYLSRALVGTHSLGASNVFSRFQLVCSKLESVRKSGDRMPSTASETQRRVLSQATKTFFTDSFRLCTQAEILVGSNICQSAKRSRENKLHPLWVTSSNLILTSFYSNLVPNSASEGRKKNSLLRIGKGSKVSERLASGSFGYLLCFLINHNSRLLNPRFFIVTD
jgi:hypothetical protein